MQYLCKKIVRIHWLRTKNADMKRILFSLLVGFSFSALHAQEWRDENRYHDPFDIYCGPTIGVAASNMTEYDGKYKFGPEIGAFIQTYFCNHFGMSFELNYSREGTRDAWANFLTDEELAITDSEGNVISHRERGPYNYNMDYINTIYKLRYYPMHRLNVFLGFKFGVHINATCTLDDKDTDIKGALRRRAAHIIGGFGYELDKLNIEAYYCFPISHLRNSESAVGWRALRDAKENVFMLTVGYRIKIY